MNNDNYTPTQKYINRLKQERDELYAIVLLYRRWEHASNAEDGESFPEMLVEASFAAQDFMDRKIIKTKNPNQ